MGYTSITVHEDDLNQVNTIVKNDWPAMGNGFGEFNRDQDLSEMLGPDYFTLSLADGNGADSLITKLSDAGVLFAATTGIEAHTPYKHPASILQKRLYDHIKTNYFHETPVGPEYDGELFGTPNGNEKHVLATYWNHNDGGVTTGITELQSYMLEASQIMGDTAAFDSVVDCLENLMVVRPKYMVAPYCDEPNTKAYGWYYRKTADEGRWAQGQEIDKRDGNATDGEIEIAYQYIKNGLDAMPILNFIRTYNVSTLSDGRLFLTSGRNCDKLGNDQWWENQLSPTCHTYYMTMLTAFDEFRQYDTANSAFWEQLITDSINWLIEATEMHPMELPPEIVRVDENTNTLVTAHGQNQWWDKGNWSENYSYNSVRIPYELMKYVMKTNDERVWAYLHKYQKLIEDFDSRGYAPEGYNKDGSASQDRRSFYGSWALFFNTYLFDRNRSHQAFRDILKQYDGIGFDRQYQPGPNPDLNFDTFSSLLAIKSLELLK